MHRDGQPDRSAPNLLLELKPARTLLVLMIGLLVWAADSTGALALIETPVYDWFMRMRSQQNVAPAKVLLVYLDSGFEVGSADANVRLLEALQSGGAEEIVLTQIPSGAAAAGFLEECRRTDNVVLAVPIEASIDASAGGASYAPLSHQYPDLPIGAVHRPPHDRGVHRQQNMSFETPDGVVWSLEAVVAERMLGEEAILSMPVESTYRVDFRGAANSLPHISASDVLAGELIPELIQTRCVLVGWPLRPQDAGLSTPTTASNEPISLLEYQGHALNTLLNGRRITSFQTPFRLGLFLLVVLFSYLIFRLLPVSAAFWLTLALIGVYSTVGLLLFTQGGVWILLPQLILAQALTFLLFLRSRVVDLTRAFQNLLGEASRRMHEKSWPIQNQDSTISWSLIAHMINQTLDLNRVIFFQTDCKKNLLIEGTALRCSFDDVVERRRNYDRKPYSDCVDANGPIRVTDFFQAGDPDEDQYLLPLKFAGELLGFWAFGINTFKASATPRFQVILLQYSARISELLYQVTKQERGGAADTLLGRRVLQDRTEQAYTNLSSAFTILSNQLDTLQHLIHRLDTAVVVYDIFGRLLQINDPMLDHLQGEEIPPFNMSALDLLLAISDVDVSKGRRILRKVIVDEIPTTLTIKLLSQPERLFAMQVKPISRVQDSSESDAALPTIHAAIVFELVDTTESTQFSEMKSALTQRFLVQMRRDFATVDLSASLLSSLQMPLEHCYRMGGVIQERVEQAVQTVSDCQQYLCDDTGSEGLERFPVDPMPVLESAIEEARRNIAAEHRSVTIKLWEPGVTRYTLASTAELRFLFAAILDVLVKDAVEDSLVLVRFAGDENLVAIDFSNSGFGLPNQALQDYLFGEEVETTDELAKIKRAASWVLEWGGIFEASSDVGTGMHFTIHLARFI